MSRAYQKEKDGIEACSMGQKPTRAYSVTRHSYPTKESQAAQGPDSLSSPTGW